MTAQQLIQHFAIVLGGVHHGARPRTPPPELILRAVEAAMPELLWVMRVGSHYGAGVRAARVCGHREEALSRRIIEQGDVPSACPKWRSYTVDEGEKR